MERYDANPDQISNTTPEITAPEPIATNPTRRFKALKGELSAILERAANADQIDSRWKAERGSTALPEDGIWSSAEARESLLKELVELQAKIDRYNREYGDFFLMVCFNNDPYITGKVKFPIAATAGTAEADETVETADGEDLIDELLKIAKKAGKTDDEGVKAYFAKMARLATGTTGHRAKRYPVKTTTNTTAKDGSPTAGKTSYATKVEYKQQNWGSYRAGFTIEIHTIETLVEKIREGQAYCGTWRSPHDGRVNLASLGATVFPKDIDSGMSIDEALQHDFVKAHCFLGITTASHTEEKPRYRLFFLLPDGAIGDEEISLINRCLDAELDGKVDAATKDSARFCFGSNEDAIVFINQSVYLPEDFLEQARAWEERAKELEREKREAAAARRANLSELSEDEISQTIAQVRSALGYIPNRQKGEGTYDLALKITGAVTHWVNDNWDALCKLPQFQDAAGEAIGAEDMAEAILSDWDGGLNGCEPSSSDWDLSSKIKNLMSGGKKTANIGSVFYEAQERGWSFKQLEKKTDERISQDDPDVAKLIAGLHNTTTKLENRVLRLRRPDLDHNDVREFCAAVAWLLGADYEVEAVEWVGGDWWGVDDSIESVGKHVYIEAFNAILDALKKNYLAEKKSKMSVVPAEVDTVDGTIEIFPGTEEVSDEELLDDLFEGLEFEKVYEATGEIECGVDYEAEADLIKTISQSDIEKSRLEKICELAPDTSHSIYKEALDDHMAGTKGYSSFFALRLYTEIQPLLEIGKVKYDGEEHTVNPSNQIVGDSGSGKSRGDKKLKHARKLLRSGEVLYSSLVGDLIVHIRKFVKVAKDVTNKVFQDGWGVISTRLYELDDQYPQLKLTSEKRPFLGFKSWLNEDVTKKFVIVNASQENARSKYVPELVDIAETIIAQLKVSQTEKVIGEIEKTLNDFKRLQVFPDERVTVYHDDEVRSFIESWIVSGWMPALAKLRDYGAISNNTATNVRTDTSESGEACLVVAGNTTEENILEIFKNHPKYMTTGAGARPVYLPFYRDKPYVEGKSSAELLAEGFDDDDEIDDEAVEADLTALKLGYISMMAALIVLANPKRYSIAKFQIGKLSTEFIKRREQEITNEFVNEDKNFHKILNRYVENVLSAGVAYHVMRHVFDDLEKQWDALQTISGGEFSFEEWVNDPKGGFHTRQKEVLHFIELYGHHVNKHGYTQPIPNKIHGNRIVEASQLVYTSIVYLQYLNELYRAKCVVERATEERARQTLREAGSSGSAASDIAELVQFINTTIVSKGQISASDLFKLVKNRACLAGRYPVKPTMDKELQKSNTSARLRLYYDVLNVLIEKGYLIDEKASKGRNNGRILKPAKKRLTQKIIDNIASQF